ncbi:sodium ion-translocating decarboxylase subunit beta [Porcipelethomonas ammoniilytica]|uniref:sodium ion-translocating decarboxylase subunit beta n=1 Tax=Porcipelethomonas ammoniilytica TaxID=2981722 RepID=UPI0008209875|nr:sodium ion-translocating decarboxylase subunit beta [Porcipelethomonas ammoniilytica]MCU6719034.1 sodium ion-translocating decarboxylase subunit beta [Porcipelethomonas ammoniilytica]SCI67682.1 Glutaconyl-CoA decarboxylase subunit beta [uncultured Ruminococcus sp.]
MGEVFSIFIDTIKDLALSSGIAHMDWKSGIMILISFVFMYLAIVKQFEPLLLLPISFGMFLTNLPEAGMYHPELWVNASNIDFGQVLHEGGLLDILYLGVKLQIYPPLIFLGIGTMTDFGPLIANPKSFLLGAAAQAGIFLTFIGAAVLGFSAAECGSIAIIGGADGPTAIYVSSKLLSGGGYKISTGTIALAAYTYMALVPVIQPPIMKLLTSKKERAIKMPQLRQVSKTEKIIFPIAVTLIVALLVPSAAPLVGMLMLGNLFKESGVCSRLVDTAQNALMNIITIFLGISVGATTQADKIINIEFGKVIILGVVAFSVGTACGVLFGKIMCKVTGGKVNPLIGSAGVSAVPMAARVSQKVGAETDPTNFLLMNAMGPNVAGVIGSAVAAGILLSVI